MIGLDDPWFWGTIAALAAIVHGARPSSSVRVGLYALATAGLFHPRAAWPAGAALAAIVLYGFVAARTVRRPAHVALHTVALAGVFVGSQLVSPWVADVPGLARLLPLVGLPYVFLRVVHLLVEIQGGRAPRPDFVTFFAYALPFHQILAGPIERWSDFRARLDAPVAPLDLDLALAALNRLTNGFVKQAILARTLKDVVGFEFDGVGLWSWVELDLFAIWLYLDFSGYMDLVIGAGMLVGWRPPENFRWPFGSRNIVEFWTRWHITLSEWIRDHVFTPVQLGLLRGPLRGQALQAGIASYLVSMVAVGLWHRFDVRFLLYGLLQGVAIAVCKLWETALRKRLGKEGLKRYQASWPIRAVATLVTFHYVAFATMVAFYPTDHALRVLVSLFGVRW